MNMTITFFGSKVEDAHTTLDEDKEVDLTSFTYSELALLMMKDFAQKGRKPSPHVIPYADALLNIPSIDPRHRYFMENAAEISAYFLNNATGWRGPVARAVKAELKKRHKEVYP